MSTDFQEIFERDNRRCVYRCRDRMSDFEAFMSAEEDHLLPKSEGRLHEPRNIVVAGAVCNRLKGRFKPEIPLDLDDPESSANIY